MPFLSTISETATYIVLNYPDCLFIRQTMYNNHTSRLNFNLSMDLPGGGMHHLNVVN